MYITILVGAIVWIISKIALPIVKKVFIGLGLGVVVFSGMDYLLTQAFDSFKSYLGLLPLNIISVLAYLEIDRMINLIFSAYSIRAAFKTAALGAIFAR